MYYVLSIIYFFWMVGFIIWIKKSEGIKYNCIFFIKDMFNLKNKNLLKLINFLLRIRFELVIWGFLVFCFINWVILVKDYFCFMNGGIMILSFLEKSYVYY